MFDQTDRTSSAVALLAEALEFAFLLPGRAAAKVRKEAAKLLVRYIGGDLSLADEVCRINSVQAALAKIPDDERTSEQRTARLFGESVENTSQLTIVPAPEGLVPSSSRRDAYIMRVIDGKLGSQFWDARRSAGLPNATRWVGLAP